MPKLLTVVITDQEGAGSSSVSNMVGGRDKDLPSFWIPSLTPESSATTLKKPVNKAFFLHLYLSVVCDAHCTTEILNIQC